MLWQRITHDIGITFEEQTNKNLAYFPQWSQTSLLQRSMLSGFPDLADLSHVGLVTISHKSILGIGQSPENKGRNNTELSRGQRGRNSQMNPPWVFNSVQFAYQELYYIQGSGINVSAIYHCYLKTTDDPSLFHSSGEAVKGIYRISSISKLAVLHSAVSHRQKKTHLFSPNGKSFCIA